MHIPRKHFGQHFLNDQQIIQHILAILAPKPGDHLIEIGPGLGALTFPLLRQMFEEDQESHLDVIELDRDLVEQLQTHNQNHRQKKQASLNIYSEDALHFDFASLKKNNQALRIFGNLPYNISTPLIFHLLSFAPLVSDMLFMLQKEVAQRLAAEEHTEHYGRLSVMVQYHCRVELLFDVPANAFTPPPQVTSSIVRLSPYQTPPYQAKNYNLFADIVKQAFGQRRKTLRKSLKNIINDECWSHSSIRSDLRPEDLSVKDFVEISNGIANK